MGVTDRHLAPLVVLCHPVLQLRKPLAKTIKRVTLQYRAYLSQITPGVIKNARLILYNA